jgi:hypothetical protein
MNASSAAPSDALNSAGVWGAYFFLEKPMIDMTAHLIRFYAKL